MAVTRINNNQITDAVSGNVYLGIDAGAKLQNYSITSTKIANNLTYGSDLTVTGNLIVQGNTTAIDTTITTIEDPVILLASMQTGAPAVDIGFIGQRGSSENIAFVWQESSGEFVTAFTTTAESNTVITVTGYADLHTGNANIGNNATVGGNVTITGTTSLGGNIIGDANVTGTVTGGNLATGGTVSATGNITGGNVNTLGNISAFYYSGNGSQLTGVSASSANAETLTGTFIANNVINSSLQTVGILSNLSVSGDTTSGNLYTGGQVSTSGNVYGGNIVLESGPGHQILVENGATLQITGSATVAFGTTGSINGSSGDIATPGTINANGTITGGNVATGGTVSATGSITGGNIYTSGSGGDISGSGNIIGGNLITGGLITATGEVTGANLVTGGVVTATGNIATTNFFVGNGRYITGVTADSANAETLTGTFINSGVTGSSLTTVGTLISLSVSGDTTSGNLYTGGNVSSTGTVTGGNLATGGAVTATGDVTGSNLYTSGAVSATGDVTGGNVYTGGNVSATGTVTGGNVATGGNVSATGDVTGSNLATGGNVSASGDVTGGNLATGGTVSATGNITGASVNTAQVYGATGLSISTGTGNINLDTFGNVVLANTYVNGVAYPVQDQDAVNKFYVDNATSTGLSFHQPVYAATTTTLDTATGGTVSYAQPNGVSNGVGAYLQTTGSFNLIDTANVQTANTRILVKNEANAAWNGVYGWANSTTIVRTSDTDEYGSNSAEQLSINDYFFTTNGNVNAGTAFIVNEPAGTITFGTSNIGFTIFSQVTTYTANTAAGLSLTGTVFSAKVDNNTTAFDGSGNIIVKASANLTTPNIGAATGTSLSTTGTITGGNLESGGTVSATGTATVGNLATGGTVSATGTVTGGNIATGGTVSATGNVSVGNLIVTGNIVDTGALSIITGSNGNIALTPNGTGIVTVSTAISATGNISGNYYSGNGRQLTGQGMSFKITAANSQAYLVNGGYPDTTIGLVRGQTYLFEVAAPSHPFWIKTDPVIGTGNAYSTGVTNNGTGNGTVQFSVPFDAPGILYYQCQVHTGMGGVLNITDGTTIQSGNSNVQVYANGNVTTSIAGTSNVVVVSSSGMNVTGTITSGNVSATGDITGGNVATGGNVSATGTITGGNVNTGGNVSAGGNVTGTNLQTSGSGGNITGSGNISAGGNITGGNILTNGLVSAAGNVTGSFLFGDGYYISNINAANVNATKITNGGSYANVVLPNGNLVIAVGASSNVIARFVQDGIDVTGTVSASGNVLASGDVFADSNLSATGNVYARNAYLDGVFATLQASGNVLNLSVASVGGTIILGNSTPSIIKIGANTTNATLTLGNVTSTVEIPGNTTAGNVSATGNVEGNILITTAGGIDSPAANLWLNYSQLNTNTGIYDTNGNIVFFVDAVSGTASFGNAVQTINSVVSFNATNSIRVPVGNSAQRPTGATGQVRFNTTTNYLEVYDNNQWTNVGAPSYTLITDQQFNGDGTTVVFTLSGNATTAGTIVSINGVQQIPTTAYAVSGPTLTFTEAPAVGDLIDVRVLTTTTTVYSISNGLGTAEISVVDGSSNIAATGNLVVSGNVYAQNFVNTSDASLKDNVTPIDNAGQVVDGLNGVGYDWKDGSGHAYGMIAQAVEQILPEAVVTNDAGIKSVNYLMVIPFLVETVKELRRDIAEIKAQIQK